MISKTETVIWEFIRKDLPPTVFEQWVYSHPELERFWGKETYLEVVSSGFVQDRHVYEVRELLRGWMEKHTQRVCDCVTWESKQALFEVTGPGFYEGQEYLSSKFETIKSRDEWSGLISCKECKQKWYLAISRDFFDHYLLRLSEELTELIINDDKWPADFDDFSYGILETNHTSSENKSLKSVLQRLRVPLGFVTAAVFLIFARPSWLSLAIGFPMALCGVTIRAWASGHLKKNAELAVSGPYAYTRNPLYLGSFILALGCAVGGGNWWSGSLLLGIFLAVYIPVMQAEAEHMMTLFADAYPVYARNVPLLLPRLTPWQPDLLRQQQSAAFDRNLYLRYREYRALIGLLVVFTILGLKAAF